MLNIVRRYCVAYKHSNFAPFLDLGENVFSHFVGERSLITFPVRASRFNLSRVRTLSCPKIRKVTPIK